MNRFKLRDDQRVKYIVKKKFTDVYASSITRIHI